MRDDLPQAGDLHGTRVRDLPSALDHVGEILAMLAGRRLAVFLDYDGTLTPIVERPEGAALSPETRAQIERLAGHVQVAILSGRDLADVRRMVGVERIAYAGSHGFDLVLPDGSAYQRDRGFLPELDAAERALWPVIGTVAGSWVERKAFAIAVHLRQVDPDRWPEVDAAVAEVAAAHPLLRRTSGKMIFELRPAIDWDKGNALHWLLERMRLAGDGVLPIYVGDDETDEDAFRAVWSDGLGVVVRGESDDRLTLARFALRDTEETRGFLELLADAASQDDPA
jgi:trehalose-phosphatase